MSWVLQLSDDAKSSLARLQVWLQEETLDELERLASDPSLIRVTGAAPEGVYDFIREGSDGRHYLFLWVEVDWESSTLRIATIGHVYRAIP